MKKDEKVGPVFEALADANRRRVIRHLTEEGPLSATDLSERLDITRQGVAKHLQTLADAGLVDGQRSGREILYRLTPAPLGDAMGWIARAGADWDDRLANLRGRVERD